MRGEGWLTILLFSLIVVSGLSAGPAPASTDISGRYGSQAFGEQSTELYAFGDADIDFGMGLEVSIPFQDLNGQIQFSVPQLREIPPLPDSTVLFLYALSGLGAWQAGRSAKKINFSNIPDWYYPEHSEISIHDYVQDGPSGILAAIWGKYLPGIPQLSLGYYAQLSVSTNWDDPYVQAIIAPRGPPCLMKIA